ncbi:MAG: polysaccharide deacetylase family protein [Firmicutes bacterium]|nr:polysaccharide deacetylase family protein [Bacillota bacterium]
MAQVLSRRQRIAERRRQRRRKAWGIAAAAAVMVLGIAGGLRAAGGLLPPRLQWHFTPADDRLTVRLEPGPGWLGRQLWQLDRWQVGPYTAGSATRPFVRTLPPNARVRWRVRAQGPAPLAGFITLTVPAGPRLVAETRTATTLALTADQPLTAAAVSGGPVTRVGSRRLVVPRGLTPRTLEVRVEGRDGTWSVWRVSVPPARPVPLLWFGSPAGGRVYLTVDDGWVPSARLLALMQRDHLPVTAFLIQEAAVRDPAYWRAFVAAGGVIEDHTRSHPALTRVSPAAALSQWAAPIAAYRQWFGQTPLVGRPPYGAVNGTIRTAARLAGLRALVMWSVEWTPGRGFATWNHGPIQAGDIILLHWVPGVGRAVATLLPVLKARGLTPAPLLPGLGLAGPAGSPAR